MIRTLYKYTNAEYIDSILKDGGRLKLTTKKELNDANDLNFTLSQKMKENSFRMVKSVAFLLEYQRDPTSLNDKQFSFLRSVTFKNMKIAHKYEENPALNLIIDNYIRSRPFLRNSVIKIQKDFDKKHTEIVNSIKDNVLLGCLTSSFENKSMWTYYGNNYKGICVEYEIDDPRLYDAYYTNEDNVFDLYTILQYLIPFQYFKITDNPEKYREYLNAIYSPFINKDISLAHEKETRLILNLKKDSDIICENGIWFYTKAKVKAIYVGPKISDDEFSSIKEKCEKLDVKLQRLLIKEGKKELFIAA